MATLTIPARSTNVSLFLALSDFFGENEDIPPEIDLDFSILGYIEPPCITFLGNFTRWFLNMGVNVTFSGMNLGSEAIKFLDDSLFFEQHLGKKLRPSSSPRSTTLPLKHLSHADSHSWLENEFIPWLSEKSGLSITSLAEVRTCIKEVINNISDHTAYNEGCIFAQWYPKMKLIKVSIADFGCGITETVRRENPDCTDAEAILWAAQEGTEPPRLYRRLFSSSQATLSSVFMFA
jgi:anti-sigma regulatory factor (Ser/Thr protein kinase)